MSRRIVDVVVAGLALIAVSPVLVVAAIGIKASSPGPVLHRALRIGRDRRRPPSAAAAGWPGPERRQQGYRGREFTLYKLRTMRVASAPGAPITARNDSRVFPFGTFLRATKIDELPQLLNVVKGEMTLVGPRPEAPEIVRSHYSADDLLTLQVPPGVTSPGSLYYYTHCEGKLGSGDVTQMYADQLLPTKLAIDRVYLARATFAYDMRIIGRTLVVILARSIGWTRFPEPPEIKHVH